MHVLRNVATPAGRSDRRRRRFNRRRPLVVAIVAIAALVAACTGGTGAGSQHNGTVTYAYAPSDYFNWLFPIETPAVSEPWEWSVEQMLWQPLYFEGQGTKPIINKQLSLAYPPKWSDNDTTVTINLKKYVWSDGKPVTSRDVEFWWNLNAANKTQNDFYSKGQIPDDVKSIAYPSSSQIVLHLVRSYSEQWFDDNQLTWIIPMPQHEWDRTSLGGKVGNYDQTTAGAKQVFSFLLQQSKQLSTYASNPIWKVVDGPWSLQGYEPTTHTTTMVPNTKYSGPDKPKITKYVIEDFTSNSAELNALRSGSLTYGYLTSADYKLKSYFETHGYTVKPWWPQYVEWAELGYTNKNYAPLVKQLYIRQALQHLVNQPLYDKTIFHGLGLPTYGPVPNTVGAQYVSKQENTNLYPYSVSAARSLLTSHGWAPGSNGYMTCKDPGTGAGQCGAGIPAGRELELSFMFATGWPDLSAEVQSYQQSAKAAGIQLSFNPQSENTMFSIGGTCPPGPCNWGMLLYEEWMWNYGEGAILPSGDTDFTSGNYWAGGYSDATMDKLINAERYQTGVKHIFAFEDYVQQQVPVIFFPTVGQWSVVKKGLEGWQQQNPFGYTVPSQWSFSK